MNRASNSNVPCCTIFRNPCFRSPTRSRRPELVPAHRRDPASGNATRIPAKMRRAKRAKPADVDGPAGDAPSTASASNGITPSHLPDDRLDRARDAIEFHLGLRSCSSTTSSGSSTRSSPNAKSRWNSCADATSYRIPSTAQRPTR